MGILTIRRTLAHGWRSGFVTGLGIASADGIYGAFAAFGLTLITNILIGLRPAIGLIGGLFLIYLGVKTITKPHPPSPIPHGEGEIVPRDDSYPTMPISEKSKQEGVGGEVKSFYLSALGLTLTNPTTILAFIGIFAGAGLSTTGGSGENDTLCAVFMLIGVISGSILWWLTLTSALRCSAAV